MLSVVTRVFFLLSMLCVANLSIIKMYNKNRQFLGTKDGKALCELEHLRVWEIVSIDLLFTPRIKTGNQGR
jgi:hypothetical protein